MPFQLIKIDGFFRRITERHAEAGGSRVQVIIGFRERHSGSSKSPGPGWRQVPGEKRSWMKREPRTEERFVKNEEVVDSTEWPTGIEKHGFKLGQYEFILKPSIDAGVEAAGAIGKRKVPEIKIETLEMAIKEAGLAMPTTEEFAMMIEALWERDHRPKPRAATSGSATVTGRKPKTAADRHAEAEAARLADEARAAEEEAKKTQVNISIDATVFLKSGGPAMKVVEAGDGTVGVEWDDEDGTKRTGLFPVEVLTNTDPGPGGG